MSEQPWPEDLTVAIDFACPHSYLALRPTLEMIAGMSVTARWVPAKGSKVPDPKNYPGDSRGDRHRYHRATYQRRDLMRYAAVQDLDLHDVQIATRIVIFPPDLGGVYFTGTGQSAQSVGVITAPELESWTATIEDLRQRGRLFCSIGYYLFTARV